jgi:hypothetical protein
MKKIQCEPPLKNQSNDAYLNPNCIITQCPALEESAVFIGHIGRADEANEIVPSETEAPDVVKPSK